MPTPGLLHLLPKPSERGQGWPWTEETNPGIYASETDWPKITLITPNYNQGNFIEETIRSVLLQNYPNLEYLIFDAVSSDASVEIIKKYEKWITYWRSEPDQGQSHAINKGLKQATGKYFNWQNADDVLLPESLMLSAKIAEQYEDLVFLNRGLLFSDRPSQLEEYSHNAVLLNKDKLFTKLKPGYQPGGLMKTRTAVQIGGVDEMLESSMDYDLQLRLLLYGNGYFLEQPGIIFRVHPDQKTERLLDARRTERFTIYRKLYQLIPKDSPNYQLKAQSYISACQFGRQMALAMDRKLLASYYHLLIASVRFYLRLKRKISSLKL